MRLGEESVWAWGGVVSGGAVLSMGIGREVPSSRMGLRVMSPRGKVRRPAGGAPNSAGPCWGGGGRARTLTPGRNHGRAFMSLGLVAYRARNAPTQRRRHAVRPLVPVQGFQLTSGGEPPEDPAVQYRVDAPHCTVVRSRCPHHLSVCVARNARRGARCAAADRKSAEHLLAERVETRRGAACGCERWHALAYHSPRQAARTCGPMRPSAVLYWWCPTR